MLKNLEIINELHIRMFDIGTLKCKRYADCYTYFNDEIFIIIDFKRAAISKNVFKEPLIIPYTEPDCINKILNKVDEWMGK